MTPIPGSRPSIRLAGSRTLRVAVLAGLFASSALFATARPAQAVTEHVVKPGETLSIIAALYGLPVETLMDVNGLTDPDSLQAGQLLRIPTYAADPPVAAPGRYHTVQPGDTLSSLAELYGVDAADIAGANGLFDLHSVIAGATLLIPRGEPGNVPVSEAVTAAGVRHVVAAGETLSLIASNYGVRVEALVAANALPNPDVVVEGQVLVVPGALQAGPSTGAASEVVHIVAAGETLSSIASRYGVELSRLADANNLADHDVIIVGERLLIPGALTPSQTTGYSEISHVVRLGDTLSALAEQYGVRLAELVELNGISNPNLIVEGMTLALPAGAAISAAVPAAPLVPAVRTHVVAAGETLAMIAERYGVAVDVLIELNSLADPNRIIEGQALSVPGVIASRVYSLDEYEAILDAAAVEFGIPAAWLKALAWQESGWNQFVVSHAGAIGVMQVMPYTAEWALLTLVPDAADWDTNPADNVRMGAAILHHWLLRADGDLATALAAYFQGWRSLHEIGIFDETRVYVANVLALVGQFE